MTGTQAGNDVSARILGAVGLAVKVRAALVGTTLSVERMRADKGELLITACDISENTRKRLVGTAEFHHIPYVLTELTKAELSHAAGKKSDTAADRLDKARAAIPKQTKITKERVFDEAKGKAKTRLAFEKTDKPPNGKLRHNPLSRPAQELDAAVHGKIYEVEKENVGVESGHRIELVGEKAGGMTTRAVKRGIRSHKLKPYRAAAAAEKKAAKANADFLYQKALHDNPALAHSNPISRFWQKQRIKKQYAKALKTGGKVKKTAEATAKAAKKTAQETKRATFFVVRHWKGCLIVGGIAFIVLLFFGGLSSCSLFGGNSGSGLIASSYLSEDADITGAESAYVAMRQLAAAAVNKLQAMTDSVFSETVFTLTDDE